MKTLANKIIAVFGVLTLTFNVNVFSQIQFQKAIGTPSDETGMFVIIDQNGNYAITGHHKMDTLGNRDIVLLQLDTCGTILYTGLYGGIKDEKATCIQQFSNGDYAISGNTNSYGIGHRDFYLLKTKSNGTSLTGWAIGDTSNEYAEYLAISPWDSSVTMVGTTNFFTLNAKDIYVTNVSNAGVLNWTKTIGGTLNDYGYSIRYSPSDSGYIVAGSTASYGAGNFDAYIIKLNKNGNVNWARTYGGVYNDAAYDILISNNGDYIFTGKTQDRDSLGNLHDNVYVVRIKNNGTLVWAKAYGGINDERGEAIIENPDSSLVIAGNTYSYGGGSSDGYLIKLNSIGNLIWAKAYGGSNDEHFYSVVRVQDGGYFAIGYTNSFGSGLNDFYAIKTDGNGRTNCYERNGGVNYSAPDSIDTLYSYSHMGRVRGGLMDTTIVFNDSILCTTCALRIGQQNYENTVDLLNDFLITIFPNPADKEIFLRAKVEKDLYYTMFITNSLGVKISSQKIDGRQLNNGKFIDTKKLSDGLYYLVISGNGEFLTSKFIISH